MLNAGTPRFELRCGTTFAIDRFWCVFIVLQRQWNEAQLEDQGDYCLPRESLLEGILIDKVDCMYEV